MRFSFNWLKRHLSTDLNIQQIADKLTSIGLEVETVENPEEIFKNFKLVQIESAEKHPNADKLQICKVSDAQNNTMHIVCGASNARVGLKTILAMPGAIIPNSGEILKKGKIRGIESEGMMCSFEELSIPSKNDGIIEIEKSTDLSAPIGDVLGYGGGVLEVSVTPNRGDCFSVRGIARDFAAAGVGKFIISENPICNSVLKMPIEINCNYDEACSKYSPFMAFRVIRGIKNCESPDWLKSLLKSAKQNSISAIVDLANWWMIDTGRPLHIYDLNKIEGNLSIRFAHNNEEFVDIKGTRHVLERNMLIAADRESPLCLLGVMGGEKAACTKETTDILIESALFDPVSISRTGIFLNLISDSRTRFERGIDKDSCISGLEGVTKVILDTCGGQASEIRTIGQSSKINHPVTLKKTKLDNISGYEVDWNNAKLILKKLGLKEINSKDEEATFSIPSWRSDLNIEEDLIEEILRINGYDNITEKKVEEIVVGTDKLLNDRNVITAIGRQLASRGMSEVITYSFIKENIAEAFKEKKKLIHLINPISADLNVMRPSLIPGLLAAAVRSLNYGQQNVKLFEAGNIFYDFCVQELHISGLRAGITDHRNWLQKSREADSFDAKEDAFAILKSLGAEEKNIFIEHSAPSYYHPSRAGTILLGRKPIGYFGELHPETNTLFDISEKLVCFELFAKSLLEIKEKQKTYNEKVFPKISRDFAFIFNIKTSVGNMIHAIYKLDQRISKVDIFDCFDVRSTQKSIGVTVTLEAVDRTLTENEAQEISDKIIQYAKKVGGELRKK